MLIRRPCEFGVGREAVDAGDLADQFGGDEDAAAAFGEQRWCGLGDEGASSRFERVDGAGELADASQLIARDPDPRGLLGAGEAAGETLGPVHGDQAAGRDLELGPEVVQVPAQVVDQPCARVDQPLAMIDEQPDVELDPGELRDRQRLDPVADRRPGDRDRVDRIGLAALTRAVAPSGGQLRRDAHDAFPAREQEPLERPRE